MCYAILYTSSPISFYCIDSLVRSHGPSVANAAGGGIGDAGDR